MPRADRPVDSELHSTRTAGETHGVRRAARRQRDSAGRRSFATGRWPSFVWTQSATCSCYRTHRFPAPRLPLFCGDTLLVEVARGILDEAVSFSIREDRLQRDRQLIAIDDRSQHLPLVVFK